MLREAEDTIKQRSKAAESRWPLDKLIQHLEVNPNPKVLKCSFVFESTFNDFVTLADTAATAASGFGDVTSSAGPRSFG